MNYPPQPFDLHHGRPTDQPPLAAPVEGAALCVHLQAVFPAMSSEDGRLPPPPPLRSPMSPGQGGPLRNRHGLAQPPTITTALSAQQAVRSAWSASTLDTPYSPYASAGLSPFSQLPPSLPGATSPLALRPPASYQMEYNPQQWGRGGASGGEYRPHGRVAAPSGGADALDGMILFCMLIQR